MIASGSSDKKTKSNSETPTHGNGNTTSRRLHVVSNAAPTTAVGQLASGLLIPLSIVDTDHEDSEEDKFADALNQLLIKKSKKAAVKKKKAGAAAEGEITITARSLDVKEKKSESSVIAARPASSLSSSSASNYDNTVVDLVDQLESIRLHALALERWHAPQLKKVHRLGSRRIVL